MGSVCGICRKKLRPEIDEALRGGETLKAVAERFGLSKAATWRHKRKCLISEEVREYQRLCGILDRAIAKAESRCDTTGLASLIRERRNLSKEFAESQQAESGRTIGIELVYQSEAKAVSEHELGIIRELYGLTPSDLRRPASAPEPPATSVTSEIVPEHAKTRRTEPVSKPIRRREPARQPSAGGVVERENPFFPGGFKV